MGARKTRQKGDDIITFMCSAFFIVQLLHLYMTTGKTIALTIQTFVGKVVSLLFNMLSRLVSASLPRSKRPVISWLQSPSAERYAACQAPLSKGFSRQSAGVGCHSLLQGTFPTQGLNSGFPNCRWVPYHLSHQGSLV